MCLGIGFREKKRNISFFYMNRKYGHSRDVDSLYCLFTFLLKCTFKIVQSVLPLDSLTGFHLFSNCITEMIFRDSVLHSSLQPWLTQPVQQPPPCHVYLSRNSHPTITRIWGYTSGFHLFYRFDFDQGSSIIELYRSRSPYRYSRNTV